MPMMAAPPMETASHPAVTATSPARAAFMVMPTSGFLYRSQVYSMVTQQATAADMLVLTKIRPAEHAI